MASRNTVILGIIAVAFIAIIIVSMLWYFSGYHYVLEVPAGI